MIVYGIDPGTYESAIVGIDKDYKVVFKSYERNEKIEEFLEQLEDPDVHVAIEFIQSYGMGVGQSTFVTVRWIGRFERAFDGGLKEYKDKFYFYARPSIRAHICSGVRKVKDTKIRQALRIRFGESKKGHPLEGITNHLWSALAVAVTHLDGSKIGAEDWMRLDIPKPKKIKKSKKKNGKSKESKKTR